VPEGPTEIVTAADAASGKANAAETTSATANSPVNNIRFIFTTSFFARTAPETLAFFLEPPQYSDDVAHLINGQSYKYLVLNQLKICIKNKKLLKICMVSKKQAV
jgi:hypothetical protein